MKHSGRGQPGMVGVIVLLYALAVPSALCWRGVAASATSSMLETSSTKWCLSFARRVRSERWPSPHWGWSTLTPLGESHDSHMIITTGAWGMELVLC